MNRSRQTSLFPIASLDQAIPTAPRAKGRSKAAASSASVFLSRRTSKAYPIRLDQIPVTGRPGRLSLTILPGKKDITWDRDLATDVAAFKTAGVNRVFCLVPQFELDHLGVGNYLEVLRRVGIAARHLPIIDRSTLHEGGFGAMLDAVDEIRLALSVGEHVAVHCRGGLGRAGTVAACVLVADGMKANEAALLVRKHRPGAIETKGQLAFVFGFAGWLEKMNLRG